MRVDVVGARVRPDVVFLRNKVAVFVNGCFWHSCPVHGTYPARNADYWLPKLEENARRDARQDAALTAAGWSAVRIWEHEGVEAAVGRIEKELGRLEHSA